MRVYGAGWLAWMLSAGGWACGAGMEYVVEVTSNAATNAWEQGRIRDQAMAVLERRFHDICSARLIPLEESRIQVRLYNLGEADRDGLRHLLESEGRLEFREVHPESARNIAAGLLPPGHEVLEEVRVTPGFGSEPSTRIERHVVGKQPMRGLVGGHLRQAFVATNPFTRQPEIHFELDEEGARLFEEVTTELGPREGTFRHLAVVMDGTLYSAPQINEPISGGRGMITGAFTLEQAEQLVRILSTPRLEGTLRVVSEAPLDGAVERALIREQRWAAVGTLILALSLLVVAILVVIMVLLLVRRRTRRSITAASPKPPPLP